jgi:hypothetical protein
MVAGFDAKLEMVGAGGGGAADPPQPVKPTKPRLRNRTHPREKRIRFIMISCPQIF